MSGNRSLVFHCAVSLLCCGLLSSCATIKIAVQSPSLQGAWLRVVSDDRGTDTPYGYLQLLTQEFAPIRAYIETHGLPDYIFVGNYNHPAGRQVRTLYIKRETICNWQLQYVDPKLASVDDLTTLTPAELEYIPEVAKLLADRSAQEKRRADSAAESKRQTALEAENRARQQAATKELEEERKAQEAAAQVQPALAEEPKASDASTAQLTGEMPRVDEAQARLRAAIEETNQVQIAQAIEQERKRNNSKPVAPSDAKIKIKGLYIGMDILTVPALLKQELEGKSLPIHGVARSDAGKVQGCEAEDYYVAIGDITPLSFVVAGPDGKVKSFRLSGRVAYALIDMTVADFVFLAGHSFGAMNESDDKQSWTYKDSSGVSVTIDTKKSLVVEQDPAVAKRRAAIEEAEAKRQAAIAEANQAQIVQAIEQERKRTSSRPVTPEDAKIKIKGLYIGMDILAVPALLKEKLAGKQLGIHDLAKGDSGRFAHMIKGCEKDDYYIAIGGMAPFGAVVAGPDGKVKSFRLSGLVVDEFFNSSKMDASEFVAIFVKAYGIPEMKPSDDMQSWNYTSPDGVRVEIDTKKSLVVEKVASEQEIKKAFD